MAYRILIEQCKTPNPLTGRLQYRVLRSFRDTEPGESWFRWQYETTSKKVHFHSWFTKPRASVKSLRPYKTGVFVTLQGIVFAKKKEANS